MSQAPILGRAALAAALTTLLLTACGGGDGGATSTTSSTQPDGGSTGTPSSPTTPAAGPLALNKLEFAQTHVLPEGGITWTLPTSAPLRQASSFGCCTSA